MGFLAIISINRYISSFHLPMVFSSQETLFDEAKSRLGKTGKTIVYVFPHGAAYTSTSQENNSNLSATMAAESLTLLEAPVLDVEAVIANLVEQGQLTPAQVQVGRYDQTITGLTLLEVLAARGWLSEDQVDRCYDRLML